MRPSLDDRIWLEARYAQDRMPVAGIAAEAGVSQATVWRALERHGIPRGRRARHPGQQPSNAIVRAETARRRGVPVPVERAELERLVVAGLGITEIARELGVAPGTAQWHLASAGLLRMEDLPAEAVEAARLYRVEGARLDDVAAVVGRSRRTVAIWLRVQGVQIRAHRPTGRSGRRVRGAGGLAERDRHSHP